MDIEVQSILKNSVLRDLPDQEIAELARTLSIRVVEPNEAIFKAGDPPDAFYIIGSGQVRIFIKHKNRTEREFSILGPFEHFGEMSLLTDETRTANAESLVQTRLLVVPRERFEQILRDFPQLSKKFLREMREWLLKNDKIIEEESDELLKSSTGSWYDFILVLGISIFLGLSFNFLNPQGVRLIPTQPRPLPGISVSKAMQDYMHKKALIVDAMPINFYNLEHIKGAFNLPPAQFDIMYSAGFPQDNKNILVIIYGSTISAPYDLLTAQKLMLRGYNNVRVLEGGLKAWQSSGYPVEKKGSR
jgi:rhodanese-related sulfurtransferase